MGVKLIIQTNGFLKKSLVYRFIDEMVDISNLNYIIEWIDIIIPETDTPSASKALVHRFIDEMIEGFLSKNEINIIDSGIDYLKSQSLY